MGNEILAVYAACNRLRELCLKLLGETDKVKEISMNAAIASGQAGSHIRVFGEFARQVERTSQKMRAEAAKANSRVNGLMNLTLQAVVLTSQKERFIEAGRTVHGAGNGGHVDRAIGGLASKISRAIEQASQEAGGFEVHLRDFRQNQNRLYAVLNALRVETAYLEAGSASSVDGIADSLGSALGRVDEGYETIMRQFGDFMTKLSRSFVQEGGTHAQDRAL